MGLFSTHTHSHSSSHTTELVPYEKTVHEYRAPTDESVKLLNEFKEKATENILSSFKLKDNIMEVNGFFIRRDAVSWTIDIYCRFKLNGKEFNLKESFDAQEFRKDIDYNYNVESYKNAVLRLVYTKVSEIIALELIRSSDANMIFDSIDKI
jgi:PAB1-binding protein PBP1